MGAAALIGAGSGWCPSVSILPEGELSAPAAAPLVRSRDFSAALRTVPQYFLLVRLPAGLESDSFPSDSRRKKEKKKQPIPEGDFGAKQPGAVHGLFVTAESSGVRDLGGATA